MATATAKKTTKSLLDLVNERSRVDFNFIDIQSEVTQDGETILRFILDKPIDQVTGRVLQGRGKDTGKTLQLEAFDVTYVRFGSEALKEIENLQTAGKDPFKWTAGQEGKAGEFHCPELKFDVSASNREVWVVKTSLAAFGQNNRGSRMDTLAKQIADFKAQKAMKNIPVDDKKEPESVGAEE